MSTDDRKRKLALAGGLCGAAYLSFNHLLPSLPDFLMGLTLGLGMALLVLSLLPEKALEKIGKWKHRG